MKSVKQESQYNDFSHSARHPPNKVSFNHIQSYNIKPMISNDSSLQSSSTNLQRSIQERKDFDKSESIRGSIDMGGDTSRLTINFKEDYVMSRSDWFAFLKLIYNQIIQTRNDNEGVYKDEIIQLVDSSINQLPLQTLQEYLGGNSYHRKEKWLSYKQVIDTIILIDINSQGILYWDDIIDSLLIVTAHAPTFNAESTSESKIQQAEFEVEKPLIQLQQIPTSREDIQRNLKKLINKIVLKDKSILLDLSKVYDQCSGITDIMNLLSISCERNQLNLIRTISFSQLQGNIDLRNLSNLSSLVILNLSNMKGINLHQQIRQIHLPNLQFLNISNNQLSEIQITSQNFPKLKELYASYNNIRTAKNIYKLDSLKLLDLSHNLIQHYDEILCLAFHEGLVVLNLTNNPLYNEDTVGFEQNVKQLLPKILLLNPQSISKVSCFENFRDIAFSIGQKPQPYSQNQNHLLTSESSEDGRSGVVQRKINIKIAINNTTTERGDNSISSQSSPTKSHNEVQRRKVSEYNRKDQEKYQNENRSPFYQNTEEMLTPPHKVYDKSERHQEKTVQVHKNNLPTEFNNITNQGPMSSQYISSDTSNTFDSQLHRKLEQQQPIPIKNDCLKYFNQFQKDTSPQSSNAPQIQIQRSPAKSQTMMQNFMKSDKQKPPRSIKIKATGSSNINETQTQRTDSFLHQGTNPNIATSRTQIYDNQVNNSAILAYRDQAPSHQKIKREMSAQIKQSAKSNLEVDMSSFEISKFNKRDNSCHSMVNKRFSYVEQETVADDNKSEIAQYYERQLSSMNINTIREMTSKEICKINNPNRVSSNSISPIKAMMIQKPIDDQGKSPSKFSNIMIGSSSQRSKKQSERQSMENGGQPNNGYTPGSNQKQRSQPKKNMIYSRNQSMKQQQIGKNQSSSTYKTKSIVSADINTSLGNESNTLSNLYQNKTQSLNMKKIINLDQSQTSYSKQRGKVNDQNVLIRSDKRSQEKNSRNHQINNYQNGTSSQVGSRVIVAPRDNLTVSSQNAAGYSSTQNRGHSHSPSYGHNHTQYTEQVMPFKIVNENSPHLYQPEFIQRNQRQTANSLRDTTQQPYKNRQLQHLSEVNDHSPHQKFNHHYQHQSEDKNTPRFSERFNIKKEALYQDAMEIINAKRKKIEKKKQLLCSVTGKPISHQKMHKQSTSSNGSSCGHPWQQQQQCKENNMMEGGGRFDSNKKILSISSCSDANNQCQPFKIDLRQRRI